MLLSEAWPEEFQLCIIRKHINHNSWNIYDNSHTPHNLLAAFHCFRVLFFLGRTVLLHLLMSTARQPVLELIPRGCWHYQNKMAKLLLWVEPQNYALFWSTHCFHMGGLWPQHAEASQRGWCNRCLAEQLFGTTVYKMFLTCCWIFSWYASWTRLFLHC